MGYVVSQPRQAMRNVQIRADTIILIKRDRPMTKQIENGLPLAFKIEAAR